MTVPFARSGKKSPHRVKPLAPSGFPTTVLKGAAGPVVEKATLCPSGETAIV